MKLRTGHPVHSGPRAAARGIRARLPLGHTALLAALALLAAPARSGEAPPNLLLILADDPGETTNLYFEHPEIVERLRDRLEKFRRTGRSVPAER